MNTFMRLIYRTFTFIFIILFSQLAYAETVWIDTRSIFEKKIDGIDGDIQISHTDIVHQVDTLFPDKNTEIKLYCRSGIRAEKALSALKKAGYSNVQNVGSITNARNIRKSSPK